MMDLPDDIVRKIASYDIDLRRILDKIGKISKEEIFEFEKLYEDSRAKAQLSYDTTIIMLPFGVRKEYRLCYSSTKPAVIHYIKDHNILSWYFSRFNPRKYEKFIL